MLRHKQTALACRLGFPSLVQAEVRISEQMQCVMREFFECSYASGIVHAGKNAWR